jgi:tRNA pseudouridine38-40 synthase
VAVYRLDIAYDGTGFHGYARQPSVRTVQGELETALFHHTAEVETVVAGRTDKGVHATGQVVSFTGEEDLDCRRVQRSLNGQLSPEIAVLAMGQTDDGFHARFSATGRRYVYRVLNREAPDPFLARTSLHVTTPLDIERMDEGVKHLLGQHDFAAFCRRAEGRSTERRLREVGWSRRGALLELEIEGSSFCHQMVRSVASLAIEVGRGKRSPDVFAAVLESRDRRQAHGAARAHGLTLTEVTY